MPRLTEPPPPITETQELRERLNRIDRVDDIRQWRGELRTLYYEIVGAKTQSARTNLAYRLNKLIDRMD